METTEHYTLHGICLRLLHGLNPPYPEALVLSLSRWMVERSDIFGLVPSVVGAGRRGPVLLAEGVQVLTTYLTERLASMQEPLDAAFTRLETIAAHLDLQYEEVMILSFLALQLRQGPLADFAAMLQCEIGLSAEAVIAICCNLDETQVWTALAPQSRLVTLGLVQTDSTHVVLRDDPYTLSGLLQALLTPPR